jgi:FKBP-type peptidyl-prolyl cis-trans isomerase
MNFWGLKVPFGLERSVTASQAEIIRITHVTLLAPSTDEDEAEALARKLYLRASIKRQRHTLCSFQVGAATATSDHSLDLVFSSDVSFSLSSSPHDVGGEGEPDELQGFVVNLTGYSEKAALPKDVVEVEKSGKRPRDDAKDQGKAEKATKASNKKAKTKAAEAQDTPASVQKQGKAKKEQTGKKQKTGGEAEEKKKNKKKDKIVKQANGLQYVDLVAGTGKKVRMGKLISMRYSGMLESGKVFDSNMPRGRPLNFVLGAGEVIAGWDQGIQGMQVGGKRKIFIPAALG